MPTAHRNEARGSNVTSFELSFERPGLRLCFRQNRRFTAHFLINLACHRRSPGGNQFCQRAPEKPWQSDNRRIAKEILQEWLNRFQRIRAAQVEQDDSDFQTLPLTRSTTRATFPGGVSGRTPCPRLKIRGTDSAASLIESTARSSASPPAIRTIGSKLPCSATLPPKASAAQDIDVAVSIPIPSTPVVLA